VATTSASFGFTGQFVYSWFVGRTMRPKAFLWCKVRSFRRSASTSALKMIRKNYF